MPSGYFLLGSSCRVSPHEQFAGFMYLLDIYYTYLKDIVTEMGVFGMMNELFILSALMAQPQSGYQLRQSMTAALGHHRKISFGVIYPLFERLAQGGFITLVQVDDDKKTKLAAITPAGVARFKALMAEPIPDCAHTADLYQIKLIAMQYLPVTQQQTLLKAYITEQDTTIQHTQRFMDRLQQTPSTDHWYVLQKQLLRLKQAQVAKKWAQDFQRNLKEADRFDN
jgi:DNA-binding PadR family transcriptional regulator